MTHRLLADDHNYDAHHGPCRCQQSCSKHGCHSLQEELDATQQAEKSQILLHCQMQQSVKSYVMVRQLLRLFFWAAQ